MAPDRSARLSAYDPADDPQGFERVLDRGPRTGAHPRPRRPQRSSGRILLPFRPANRSKNQVSPEKKLAPGTGQRHNVSSAGNHRLTPTVLRISCPSSLNFRPRCPEPAPSSLELAPSSLEYGRPRAATRIRRGCRRDRDPVGTSRLLVLAASRPWLMALDLPAP